VLRQGGLICLLVDMVCMNSVANQILVEFINDLNKDGDAERSMVVVMWQGASMTTWKLKQLEGTLHERVRTITQE
jgi:hypothetical protein